MKSAVVSYSYSGGCPKKPTTSNLRLDIADSCFDAVPYKKTSKAVAIACLVLGNTLALWSHPLKLTAVEVVLVNMRPISDLIGLVLTETKAYKDLHHMFCSSQFNPLQFDPAASSTTSSRIWTIESSTQVTPTRICCTCTSWEQQQPKKFVKRQQRRRQDRQPDS